jgi:transcription antitermination factor NusG
VLNTPGASGFVGFSGGAETVPDAEIDALRLLVATEIRYDPHPFLSEGMLVEVTRGPLAGIRGRILRKDRSTKLVLAVTLIRQGAALEIHPADVVPV